MIQPSWNNNPCIIHLLAFGHIRMSMVCYSVVHVSMAWLSLLNVTVKSYCRPIIDFDVRISWIFLFRSVICKL